MACKTCGQPCKIHGYILAYSLSSTQSGSTLPFDNFDKISEPLILSGHLIPALDASSTTLSIAEYIKKNLKFIFKMVLETQASTPASLIFLEGLRKYFLKTWFLKVYTRENQIDCYNFCQQCEDHFTMVRAKNPNQIYFANSFLRDLSTFVISNISLS